MTNTLHRAEAIDTSPFGRPTVHGSRQRRRWVRFGVAVALLLALTATVATVRMLTDDSRRDYLSSNGWPTNGQGAYQLGNDSPRASADQRPVPIASLAKVMTAYLVVTDLPLRRGASGPSLLVTPADVADTTRRRTQDQSTVSVAAGERLSERQALAAVLLASANNIASMVTRYSSDSPAEFVVRMNRTARHLGMTHTTYTDPSGFDSGTVSTAADQLLLARVAAANPTLATVMAMRQYRIPVAGTIHNTDVLLGHGGFVGMKTGSDDAAGGCFMFRANRMVDGRKTELIGVVLGQPGRNLVLTGQYSARQLANKVAPMS